MLLKRNFQNTCVLLIIHLYSSTLQSFCVNTDTASNTCVPLSSIFLLPMSNLPLRTMHNPQYIYVWGILHRHLLSLRV